MTTLFQVGNVVAFFQGVYESDYSFAELSKKGDCGLGTFNGVDGEMIAVDGCFYRMDKNGQAEVVEPKRCTPFSVVSFFKKMPAISLKGISSLNELNNQIDRLLPTPNIFYMIRIDGEFECINLRSEACQMKPYRPLAETLPQLQTAFDLIDSKGTLVVTRCPSYSAGCTISGYHYHYIDSEKKTGGHVFDLKMKLGAVQINPIRRFEMHLQDSQAFDTCDLHMDMNAALKAVE